MEMIVIELVLTLLGAALMAYLIEDWWKHRNDDR